MDKPAQTQFPIHDLLLRRWSPRAFDERPVESHMLWSLFEAARWAPSSNNEQPWRFIVATKRDHEMEWKRLFDCLAEGNRVWVIRAPVLILSIASLNFEDDGKPNRHAFHDTGLAVENLVLQATASGLVAHQMAGFDVEKARVDLKIPSGYEPVAMIAVGYPGDPAVLPERLRERELRPRSRRPIGESTFFGRWGTPIP
ncbi:nitroreductase family protein [Candidatus Nitrospira nitrificans]|uniref:Nitroreductase n=1 Tax=Candidatus Nitrospira nitrificans TaxID=1742973 RepID=A0A0S4L7J6_9BACT|nr:nitroreductase family protein [Candidatus Nitrospira nitrificans]CUS32573.1 Nitroreductase [Candidatus Nitrospira nitrificans]